LEADQCTFFAEITADYGDNIHFFTLNCTAEADGSLRFVVSHPDTIEGVSGITDASGGKLTFDDVLLAFPMMADGYLSPVSAPWIMLKTLRSGYMKSGCIENDLLRLTIDDTYGEDALTLDVWIENGKTPVRAEMLYSGRKIITITVKDFQIS